MIRATLRAAAISRSVSLRAWGSRAAVENVRWLLPFAKTSVMGAWIECSESADPASRAR